jgi:hypothetical protein
MFIAGLDVPAKDDGSGNGSTSRRQSLNEDKDHIRSPDTAEGSKSPKSPSAAPSDSKDGAGATSQPSTSPSAISDQFDTLKASLRRLFGQKGGKGKIWQPPGRGDIFRMLMVDKVSIQQHMVKFKSDELAPYSTSDSPLARCYRPAQHPRHMAQLLLLTHPCRRSRPHPRYTQTA